MIEEFSYEIILPIENHARIVWYWRNDPLTSAMSFSQMEKKWEHFWKEFHQDYFSFTVLPSLFVHFKGKRIGYLRFRSPLEDVLKNRKACEISINISKESRGLGLSKLILKNINNWVLEQGIDDIYAYVKESNIVSQKSFSAAGYIYEGKVNLVIDDQSHSVIRYHMPLREISFFNKGTYIIAEAGSNWRLGEEKLNIETGKHFIEVAAEAGVDCIKFQVFKTETLYVKNAGQSHYLSDAGIKEDINRVLINLAMPYEDIALLKNHCDLCKIDFMASFFSANDFMAVDPFVKVHKIASYENTHPRLIELAAKSQKPLILSTGASTLDEIKWAVNYFHKHGGKELILLQCTAKYPANLESLNLDVITKFKEFFHLSVGLSDHSKDPLIAPLAAVALGAKVIEKHFTIDRNLPGPDQLFSILPDELKEMVKSIRMVETALGSSIKKVTEEEKELYQFAKRSVQATKEIQLGEEFHEHENIEILRPGNQNKGCHPKYIDELEGKKAARNIPSGDGIQLNDWK